MLVCGRWCVYESNPPICDFSNITNYLTLASSENNIIWLNSLDVSELAVKHKLLTDGEVDNMKNIFNQKINPLSILKEYKTNYSNNPFSEALKNFKV